MSSRAVLAGGALLGGVVLAVAGARGLGQGSVYYYTPSELGGKSREEVVRVGGTVVRGSVRFDERAGVLHFAITDGARSLRVANRGAPPDLFRPGREALVEGRLAGGLLRSSDVIVKHDEEYRAPDRGSRSAG